MGVITPALDYAQLAEIDRVIEAVFKNMEVKGQVFRKLDAVVKQGAILASNTSYLDANRIAGFAQRPQDDASEELVALGAMPLPLQRSA